jgi:hypothetical protein
MIQVHCVLLEQQVTLADPPMMMPSNWVHILVAISCMRRCCIRRRQLERDVEEWGMLGCFCVATQSSSTFELDITNFSVQSSNTDQQEDR